MKEGMAAPAGSQNDAAQRNIRPSADKFMNVAWVEGSVVPRRYPHDLAWRLLNGAQS
jgi:hypothetical protein